MKQRFIKSFLAVQLFALPGMFFLSGFVFLVSIIMMNAITASDILSTINTQHVLNTVRISLATIVMIIAPALITSVFLVIPSHRNFLKIFLWSFIQFLSSIPEIIFIALFVFLAIDNKFEHITTMTPLVSMLAIAMYPKLVRAFLRTLNSISVNDRLTAISLGISAIRFEFIVIIPGLIRGLTGDLFLIFSKITGSAVIIIFLSSKLLMNTSSATVNNLMGTLFADLKTGNSANVTAAALILTCILLFTALTGSLFHSLQNRTHKKGSTNA
jgi:ABC-type phosphate transport system permease subunit